MYNKKQIKLDLKAIELEVCEDLELVKIKSDTMNRYKVSTIYGNYSFFFDSDSIFGKFEDIKKYSEQLPDKFAFVNGVMFHKKHCVNRFTGKFNFHYDEVYDFMDELYRIATKFQ